MVVLFKTGKNLNENNINPNIKAVEYAVCGPVVLRAQQLEQEIAQVCIYYQYLECNF